MRIRQCKLVVNIKKWVDINKYKYVCIKMVPTCRENWQYAFLAKIQNLTNKKSGMEILLLSKFLVMWSKTWMVVVFPIQVFGYVIKNLDGSGFSHPHFLDSSSFYHPTFLTVVFWQFFFCNIAPILNFCQECYYREI